MPSMGVGGMKKPIALLVMSCSKVGMKRPNSQCTTPVKVLPRTANVAAMPLLFGSALCASARSSQH